MFWGFVCGLSCFFNKFIRSHRVNRQEYAHSSHCGARHWFIVQSLPQLTRIVHRVVWYLDILEPLYWYNDDIPLSHDDVIKWTYFPRYCSLCGEFTGKQWWGWWFETLSCPLWRHCNAFIKVSRKPRTPSIVSKYRDRVPATTPMLSSPHNMGNDDFVVCY